MAEPVEPVQAAAPTTGLLASAVPSREAGERWQSGFAWRPERCITTQGYGPCGDIVGRPEEPDDGAVRYYPPAYRVRDYCTTLGPDLDAERLRRQAEAVASYEVAQELWGGALTRGNPQTVDGSPYENPYLADGMATVVDGAALAGPAARLALLEQEARQAAKGQQVFLHLPVSALYGELADSLRRSGNLLYTLLDSVVVADAGYPGTGDFVAGTAEVQQVSVQNATGGTFTLTYSGATTAGIAYNASPATVQSALEALANVEPGDLAVSGTPGDWMVTFSVELGNVPQMSIDGTALTDDGVTPHAESVTTTTEGAAGSTTAGTWAYATGPVQTRLSSVEIISDMQETLNRLNNRQEIWATRLFAATFDPCVHHAIRLDDAA